MQRINGLELARFLAALSVIYGHLVWAATYNTDLSFYVGTAPFPLIPANTHWLWVLQSAVAHVFPTANITVVGVALFFVLTGWLTPDLLQRNTRMGYLLNRVFRIFPALIISTFIVALIQKYLSATAVVDAKNIFGTATTTYREIGGDSLNGVVWTLVVEVRFYLLCFCVGRWTCPRLIGAGVLLLAVCDASYMHPSLLPLSSDASYIIFILWGTALRQIWEAPDKRLPIATLFFLIVAFNLSRIIGHLFHFTQDFTIMDQIIVYNVFVLSFFASKHIGDWIQPWAALTYPLYLLHLGVGLAVIRLTKETLGSTGAVFAAVCSCFCVAYIFTKYVEIPSIALGKKMAALYRNPKPTLGSM